MSPAEIRQFRTHAIAARRDELLTVKEYAWIVRQHEKTVRRRIQHGRQPGAVNIGGQWRIDIVLALQGAPDPSCSPLCSPLLPSVRRSHRTH